MKLIHVSGYILGLQRDGCGNEDLLSASSRIHEVDVLRSIVAKSRVGEETFLSVDLLLPDGGALLFAKVVVGNWWVRSFLFEKGKRGVKSFFKTHICSLLKLIQNNPQTT